MFTPANNRRLPRHAMLSDEDAEESAQLTEMGVHNLLPSERFWQERQPHLNQHGYILRPRYSPDWKPSWIGTNMDPYFCEDSIKCLKRELIDARRRKDNALVAVKAVPKDSEEVRIAQFLTSLDDTQNHCVPILEVLPDALVPEWCLMVMPYLHPCNDPHFYMVSEVVDFVDQTLEGLAFVHRHGVAHRDISVPNIMMDARRLYPDGHHPMRRNFTPDALYEITPLTRTEHPVRYFYIDFGLSTRFAPGSPLYVVGNVGRDRDVPELSDDVPYDPFKVDIFSLGNVYSQEFEQKYHHTEFLSSLIADMKQDEPSKRSSIEDAIVLWNEIKSRMEPPMYRTRLGPKSEQAIERVFNDTVAAAWQRFNNLKRMVN